MITDVPVTLIDPSPFQHRRNFDRAKLTELARSIKTDGLIQPITTRRVNDRYELIAGERRWRAALLNDAPVIMARVIEATDAQARRLCAAENLQRDDLSAVEQVEAIVDMVDAELIEDDEYAKTATKPVERVKWLLGRLDAVEVSKDRGSEVNGKGERLFNKFVEQVGSIFTNLPRPIDWRSFYRHDLPIVTDLDPAVREWAIDHKLNKSQAKALNEIKEVSPTKFQEITTQGAVVVTEGETARVQVEDMSARELKTIAKQEKALAVPRMLHLAEDKPLQPIAPTVKPGEWWQLGPHMLYCGDTSTPEFIDKVPSAAFAFADPPYNANAAEWDRDFTWAHDWLLSRAPIVAVTPGIISIPDFYRLTIMRHVWSLACWIDNGMTRSALGFGNWIYIGLFAQDGVSVYRQSQDFIRVSIQSADNDATDHKGRKPSELMTFLVNAFTKEGETVIDPFLGSGTTLLVAEVTRRRCVGGDINPVFCTNIIRRWETMTLQQARRISG